MSLERLIKAMLISFIVVSSASYVSKCSVEASNNMQTNLNFTKKENNKNLEFKKYNFEVEKKINSGIKQANFKDEKLARSLIQIESDGRINATSHQNALGLTQVLIETAKEIDSKATKNRLLNDGQYNVYIGLSFFDSTRNEYYKMLKKKTVFKQYNESFKQLYGLDLDRKDLAMGIAVVRYHGGNRAVNMIKNPDDFKKKMPKTYNYGNKMFELYFGIPTEEPSLIKKLFSNVQKPEKQKILFKKIEETNKAQEQNRNKILKNFEETIKYALD